MISTFGGRSLQVVSSWMELMINCVVFVANQRIPRNRCPSLRRCQPRRAASDGRRTCRRGPSCKTETLQSSRHLPNDGAASEFMDNRTSDVARFSATAEANNSQDPSHAVLRCACDSCGSGNDSRASRPLHRSRGQHQCSSEVVTFPKLEALDANGICPLVSCCDQRHGDLLRLVYRALPLIREL